MILFYKREKFKNGSPVESKDVYAKILNKTKGTWTENWDILEKKRRVLELVASKRRKHP